MIRKVCEPVQGKDKWDDTLLGGCTDQGDALCRKVHIIKDELFPVPPLFNMIQEESGTAWKEMYQVFNMGHRFEIYTDEAQAKVIIEIAGKYKIDARS